MIPAPVLPMHPPMKGVRVVAYTPGGNLRLQVEDVAAYEDHRDFFERTIRYSGVNEEGWCLVYPDGSASYWLSRYARSAA